MVQEFSTILACGGPEVESYIHAVLPACLEAGANGFLWWCLRDVRAAVEPYLHSGFEGRLGLVDAHDRVKPQLECVMRFFRSLRDWTPPAPRPPADLALYWPLHYYRRDNPANPGNEPTAVCRRMLAAYYLLTQSGHRVDIVRGGQPFPPGLRTLIIAGALLTSPEIEAVRTWVEQGGQVLWSGPAWRQWTEACDALLGAQPVSIKSPRAMTVECFGERWTLPHFPADGRTEVRLTTAHVLAAAADGAPAIIVNTLGKGRAVAVLPIPEETIASVAADRPARDRWRRWYDGLVALASPSRTGSPEGGA